MRRYEHNTRGTEITDPLEALGHLFCSRLSAGSSYALLIVKPKYKGDDAPRIERDAVGGAYTMEITSRQVWFVTERVARELIERGWVDSGLKKWGYTDHNQRQITDAGVEEWFRFCDACANAVEAFARMEEVDAKRKTETGE